MYYYCIEIFSHYSLRYYACKWHNPLNCKPVLYLPFKTFNKGLYRSVVGLLSFLWKKTARKLVTFSVVHNTFAAQTPVAARICARAILFVLFNGAIHKYPPYVSN